MPQRQKLWTRAYVLLCTLLFLISGQQAMVLVVLPLYVTHLGGSAFLAGLVLFAFSAPSFLSRPIVGYWADTWSVVSVFTLGALLLGLATPFSLLPILGGLVVVSIIRGLGWAGAMTGSYAMLAHLSPTEPQGEASGYFSSAFSATNILFPARGLWLVGTSSSGYRAVFVLGSVLALATALMSHTWLRPAVPASRGESAAGKPGVAALILERSVLLPTLLSLSLVLAQPAVIAFLPLFAKHQGIANIASYFVLSGLVSIAIRPLLGRVDDHIGPCYSIVVGFLAQMAGVVLVVGFGTLPAILVGGVLNAVGFAACNASIVGLAVALSDPRRRGAAMATFTISFQLGTGIGSVLAGALVSLSGYGGMYVGSLVVLAAGLLLALKNWPTLGHVSAPPLSQAESAR